MSYRLEGPPTAVGLTQSDNIALVPGDLLPYRKAWQQAANQLPDGAVLIVLPANNPRQKEALLAVAKLLGEEGHQVGVRPAETFLQPSAPRNPDRLAFVIPRSESSRRAGLLCFVRHRGPISPGCEVHICGAVNRFI